MSGSMRGGKLDEAKRCIAELVKTCLLFGDTLELVTFANTVKTVMPQSKYVREVLPQPPATAATPHSSGRAYFSQETLDDTLKALVAGGCTALYDAVQQCMHRLEAAHSGRSDAHESGGFRQRFCQLIVVTDGEDAGSSTSLEEA
jgi:Mg-chelatase subunit ChlD